MKLYIINMNNDAKRVEAPDYRAFPGLYCRTQK